MCQIYIKQPGTRIPNNWLRLAFDNNPDGFGMLTVRNGQVEVIHELASWSRVKELVHAATDCLAVIHFRFGTAGEYGLSNLHPFALPHGWWLFHNGTLRMVKKDHEKNDTRVFIETYLRPLMESSPESVVEMIPHFGKFIGKNNRMVLVSPEGNVHLINEKTFHRYTPIGLVYANQYSHYRPSIPPNQGKTQVEDPSVFRQISGEIYIDYFYRVAVKVSNSNKKYPSIFWTRLSNIDYDPAKVYRSVFELDQYKVKRKKAKTFVTVN